MNPHFKQASGITHTWYHVFSLKPQSQTRTPRHFHLDSIFSLQNEIQRESSRDQQSFGYMNTQTHILISVTLHLFCKCSTVWYTKKVLSPGKVVELLYKRVVKIISNKSSALPWLSTYKPLLTAYGLHFHRRKFYKVFYTITRLVVTIHFKRIQHFHI